MDPRTGYYTNTTIMKKLFTYEEVVLQLGTITTEIMIKLSLVFTINYHKVITGILRKRGERERW